MQKEEENDARLKNFVPRAEPRVHGFVVFVSTRRHVYMSRGRETRARARTRCNAACTEENP